MRFCGKAELLPPSAALGREVWGAHRPYESVCWSYRKRVALFGKIKCEAFGPIFSQVAKNPGFSSQIFFRPVMAGTVSLSL